MNLKVKLIQMELEPEPSSATTKVGGTTLHPTCSLAIAKDPRAPSKLHYASVEPKPHTLSASFYSHTHNQACTLAGKHKQT